MSLDLNIETWPIEKLRHEYENRQHEHVDLRNEIDQLQGQISRLSSDRRREYDAISDWEQSQAWVWAQSNLPDGYDVMLNSLRAEQRSLQGQASDLKSEIRELDTLIKSKLSTIAP